MTTDTKRKFFIGFSTVLLGVTEFIILTVSGLEFTKSIGVVVIGMPLNISLIKLLYRK
jgi:hypothetical protein